MLNGYINEKNAEYGQISAIIDGVRNKRASELARQMKLTGLSERLHKGQHEPGEYLRSPIDDAPKYREDSRRYETPGFLTHETGIFVCVRLYKTN
jgi:hypothetical protein